MSQQVFDVIVLGAGGVGSATVARLAARGAKVLAIDQFGTAHDRGSSHGHTRIIRRAYFEHPDYVPLLKEASAGWEQLQQQVGRRLYYHTGLIQIGPPAGEVIRGVLRAAEQHNLDVESLSASEVRERYPSLAPTADQVGVFEAEAGYLLVEECVRACHEVARTHGATILTNERVTQWQPSNAGVHVSTTLGQYSAGQLVIAAGAWSSGWLGDWAKRLTVLRKHVYWYHCDDQRLRADSGFPVYLFEIDGDIFYGFPQIDQRGVKVSKHSGGTPVEGDPTEASPEIESADQQQVELFLRRHLPTVRQRLLAHSACCYTMSTDGHFIVGRHPQCDRVIVAAGFSGHGFKFVPVIGEALADLALAGETSLPVGFLSPHRWD